MGNFLITLVVALIFALLAAKVRIPAAPLLGSIFGVILWNTFTEYGYFPAEIKIFSTSLIGAYIGCRIDREDLIQLKKIGMPVVFMVVVMFLYNLLSSFILINTTTMDFKTAFLAMAPGGIVDMSLVALDMGANAPNVTTIQMFRLIIVIGISPFAIKGNLAYFKTKGFPDNRLSEPAKKNNPIDLNSVFQPDSDKTKLKKLAATIMVAIIGGFLGKLSSFPAGNLLFAILAVGFINIFKDYAYMSVPVRKFAQILSGALIGMQFIIEDLVLIMEYIVPIVLAVGGWIIINQILGIMLNRWAKIPLITALFSTSAGGMTDMGIIASEMGGNSLIITTFQFARLLSVLLFYPIIVHFLLQAGWVV